MAEQGRAPACPEEGPDAMLAALRAQGAERLDPVRFQFIEALARRADAMTGASRKQVEERLNQLLLEYGDRFTRARAGAAWTLAQGQERFPAAAPALAEHFQAGDFSGLRQRFAELEAQGAESPFAGLLARLGQLAADMPAPTAPLGAPVTAAQPTVELKAVQYFRDTWSQLSAEQQLAESLAQAPENAGPLNSHHLVLRALQTMREVSPDYLQHFLSYAETLLWLEQANPVTAPAAKASAKAAPKGDGERKGKSRRSAG